MFYFINNTYWCCVHLLTKRNKSLILHHKNNSKNLDNYINLYDRIDEFYFMFERTKTICFFNMTNIQRRCLIINAGMDEIVTPCVDLDEHD